MSVVAIFINTDLECVCHADSNTRKNTQMPMVGGSLRVLRLLPPLKVVAMI